MPSSQIQVRVAEMPGGGGVVVAVGGGGGRRVSWEVKWRVVNKEGVGGG